MKEQEICMSHPQLIYMNEKHQGMPELQTGENITSFFEFWPTQLIYFPVILQWLFYAIRYRSLTLPLIANPGIPLSGMVGQSKTAILETAGKKARKFIAPYFGVSNTFPDGIDTIEAKVAQIEKGLQHAKLSLPLVAKPELGCRGVGIRVIRKRQDLIDYLSHFPVNASFLLQQKIEYEAEAGIFYIRYPGEKKGYIFSLTLKYAPYVTGDGIHTLQQLIKQDPRANKIADLYLQRNKLMWDKIVPENMAYRLVFSGSHCRGSIFKSGNFLITKALEETFDEIVEDIDGYYYGRFDIRFKDSELLKQGKDFSIIEINGASSEAAHIWDSDGKYFDAIKTLLFQYKTLFEIAHLNRQKGFKPASIKTLFDAYKKERKLVQSYPETE